MNTIGHVADAVVAGAGVAGCATAIHLACQGARVVVLEPNPHQPRRFAGEWLHPPGVRELVGLGIDVTQLSHARGRGFAVFFEGSSEPVLLPYPRAAKSVSFEHSQLVSMLHARVRGLREVTFIEDARLVGIDGAAVGYRLAGCDEARWVEASLIVGADGRSSRVRNALGWSGPSSVVSHMAGCVVDDLELVDDGFAHVLVGRPGPVLIYRLSKYRVRICFDVPTVLRESCRTGPELWSVYRDVFPASLRRPVQMALETGRIQWAANRLQRREFYGEGCVALVGDAVGSTHPLSASGLTIALLDAECLARTGDVSAYARERLIHCGVPELVADCLYRIVAGEDAGSAALRAGLNRVWRRDAGLTARTMRLLTTEETGMGSFFRIVLRGVAAAVYEVGSSATLQDMGSTARDLVGLVVWLRWLVGNRRGRPAWRAEQTARERRAADVWTKMRGNGWLYVRAHRNLRIG